MLRFLFILATLAAIVSPSMAQSGGSISAANLNILQLNGTTNDGTEVLVTSLSPFSNLTVRPGSSRGDYNIAIFGNNSNGTNGILMSAVSQNGRDNSVLPNIGGNTAGPVGVNFATPAIERGSGTYASGGDETLFISMNHSQDGGEFNINCAAAYFPFSAGWVGGYARNETNNTVLTATNSVLSPGLAIGTQFTNPTANGIYNLNLTGVGGVPVNASQNGILLVNGGRNEDNYALSRALPDGTFTIICKDNGANGSAYENDPVAFVYIPNTATEITSGRVQFVTTTSVTLVAGVGTSGLGAPTVSHFGTGQVLLTIAGVTDPNMGSLIISAEGENGNNVDNIVTYEWSTANTGWIIQSRDLTGTGTVIPGLQNMAATQDAFSFAFVPVPEPTTLLAFGTIAGFGLLRRRKAA